MALIVINQIALLRKIRKIKINPLYIIVIFIESMLSHIKYIYKIIILIKYGMMKVNKDK